MLYKHQNRKLTSLIRIRHDNKFLCYFRSVIENKAIYSQIYLHQYLLTFGLGSAFIL